MAPTMGAGSTCDNGVDDGHDEGTTLVDFFWEGIVTVANWVTGVVSVMRLLGIGESTA